ncbi:MAG: branched-chain amino acid ABC transporter permease [Spirochaetales bacterium]|uniref:Branched-chain amino acid ABC transporter permease n=1 Tax=Candidatus Thalassospirochaeta sargassi TaxID=3119039 RepID=A0AAJ1IB34_9SPIO|nr:branched-chain amino acid ABC transporter permease [Spirochaetales bacterium]
MSTTATIKTKKEMNLWPLALFIGGGIIIALGATGSINKYIQTVIMFIGINVILSASLNVVNGYMGEFSCGHGGFMLVGAYVSSILSVLLFTNSKWLGHPILPPSTAVFLFPVIIIIGGLVAAVAGLLVAIPSFKTRDDYLAIITIAANFIFVSLVNNLEFVGGSRGFMGMKGTVFAMEDVFKAPYMLFWTLTFCSLAVFLIKRLMRSTFGKGISAIRYDEISAEIMSVNTNHMKLVAFMFSSGLAGIAGGLFAHVMGFINPASFSIMKSTEALVMVYLGGMGSLSGSVLSAIIFTILLEAMRPLQILKWVLIPLMLILLMQFRPEGLMGNKELTDKFPRLKRFFTRSSM